MRANAHQYGYSAQHIGVSGASAGGHLAAILGTGGDVPELEGRTGGNRKQSSRVQAVVDMCGVIRVAEWPKSHVGLSNILGLEHAEDNGAYELAHLSSPDRHLTRDDPPLLILHGDNDKAVPLKQSQDFHQAYRKAGLSSLMKFLPKTAHVSPNFTDATRQKPIKEFYEQHLSN